MKKAQLSIIEIPIMLLLIGGILFSVPSIKNTLDDNNDKDQMHSVLNSIYMNDSNRNLFMLENLSSSTLTENWTNLNSTLNNIYFNFELKISNNSIEKKIFSCTGSFDNKDYSEIIISIKNNTVYEFRTVELGVCY